MRFTIIVAILSLNLLSCASTDFVTVVRDIRPSADSTYGYTPSNPIQIGYWNVEKSIHAGMLFLSLLTKDGHQLKPLMAATVEDPKGVTTSFLPSRFGSNITGGLLDAYTVWVEETTDTLELYFDAYHDAPLAIPKGLTMQKIQEN